MSNVISALNGATSSSGIANITEIGLLGMITLRGELNKPAMKKAIAALGEITIPQKGQINTQGDLSLAWMSPDELLLLCPYAEVAAHLATLNGAFGNSHALAVNVSDARASFRVSGPLAREVMGKLAPVDFSSDGFKLGMFRRSRMAQIAAAFWMDTEDSYQIICFRSNAQYMFDLLTVAAQSGSEVGLYAAR